MAQASRAGVSAEAFVAVIAAYADRVHDDVRRLGCLPAEAAEVVESSAFALLEDVRLRPERVGDLVGGWFRDARGRAERVVVDTDPERSADPEDEGGGPSALVRRSEDDAAARVALAELDERDRIALLLRDAYDLPYAATAVALGVDQTTAARLVARARLRFLDATGQPVPSVVGHEPELATLGRDVDHTLAPPDSSALRRHLAECRVCATARPALAEARRVLSGLAILALPDVERDAILARISTRAASVLPSAAVLADLDGDDDSEPRSRAAIAVAGLVAALIGGVLFGVITSTDGSSDATGVIFPSPSPDETSPSATLSASPSASATPSPGSPSPSVSAAASVPPPTKSPERPRPPAPNGPAGISLSSSSGPNNATITVFGSDWQPGIIVYINYLDPLRRRTGSMAEAIPDSSGAFAVDLVTHDPQNIPGPHRVVAEDSTESAAATYTATS